MTDNETTAPVPPARAVFLLVVTTFFWGGSFVFNKIGFREIDPILFFFLRFLIATILMGLICLPRLKRLNLTTIRRGSIVGLALAATNLSFVLGVSGTSISRAGFLNNLFVLIVPLLSFVIWRVRVSREVLAGIVLAVLGLWSLARGGVDGFNQGDVFSTLCAFFISLHIIAVSRVLRDEDVFLVTLVQFATVMVVGGVATAVVRPTLGPIGPTSIGALAYCAAFPTVVCFTLQNTYQRYTTPTRAGLIYTLDPVWTLIGGMLILGERLRPQEWVGAVLVLAAVVGPLSLRLFRERGKIPVEFAGTP